MRAETRDERQETGDWRPDYNYLSPSSCLLSPVVARYASAVPHSMQNFAPGWTLLWHLGQDGALSDAPHSLQNFALATTLAPHWGQCLACACAAAGAWLGCRAGVS